MDKLADMSLWQGRVDTEENPALAARLHQVIQPFKSSANNEAAAVALLGFASDEGVRRNKGRVGAAKGPDILRGTMANLPWNNHRSILDMGNVGCKAGQLEQAHLDLAEKITVAFRHSEFVFVLGGGHEIAYGSWLGLANSLEQGHVEAGEEFKSSDKSPPCIGVINFDAHFDLRDDSLGASSGTPFFQIAQSCEQKNWPFHYACFGVSEASNTQALFQRADQLNVNYRIDEQMTLSHLDEASQQLSAFIDQVDVIYLTICLDVLPASVAPGVSAPAARGVNLEVIETLVKMIKSSGKLKLADIAEFNPDFDIDQWTARIAARLFYLISHK